MRRFPGAESGRGVVERTVIFALLIVAAIAALHIALSQPSEPERSFDKNPQIVIGR